MALLSGPSFINSNTSDSFDGMNHVKITPWRLHTLTFFAPQKESLLKLDKRSKGGESVIRHLNNMEI